MEQKNATTRRNFILSGAAAAISGGVILAMSGCNMKKGDKQVKLEKKFPQGSIILFQGDSITDMGRERKNQNINDLRAMGAGYPAHISGHLLTEYPQQQYKIYTRGISGNKVFQLQKCRFCFLY